MGVSDLIAKDADDYCRIAIELGRSKGYRDGMREVLYDKSSVLFSNPVVVTEFETFLEQCMNGNVIDHPVQDYEAKT
jgi:predicted O-linked N-acetylglucosamine transferase (SPINDLY family)